MDATPAQVSQYERFVVAGLDHGVDRPDGQVERQECGLHAGEIDNDIRGCRA
ncbi:hypothetical protein [Nonomuraea sp. B19D2]|uniref:hypothetical protein n=1 Tax=Nonomuraea sp. B19D2 TaxID=3159561 RepID=UPI0032DAD5F9